jgi:hypothetical protein
MHWVRPTARTCRLASFGAAAEGEREAAEAEVERLKAKLDEVSGRDPPSR